MSHSRNARIHAKRRPTVVGLATAYDEQTAAAGSEFVIPEDLAALNDQELAAVHAQAVEHFDALYGDGTGLSDEDMGVLASLTDGIEALGAETAVREAASAERAEQAAALAARIRPADQAAADTETGDEDEPVDEADENAAEDEEPEEEPEDLVAAAVRARGAIRVPLSSVRSRAAARQGAAAAPAANGIRDVLVASGDGLGVGVGTGLDWAGAGRALDRRLGSFNQSQYAAAARSDRHVTEQHSLVALQRTIPTDLTIQSNDQEHISSIFDRAVDQSRLPGGSLVASGGWCAPSETLYDLLELESRDGLFSIPEVGVTRGGINFTKGPSFSDIYAAATGFAYTEDQDEAGTYGVDANGVGNGSAGTKPVLRVTCPPFEEARLGVDGIAVVSGLLQQRGYPEVLARTLRGTLVAHDHRLNGKLLARMAAGSTAVAMPAGQVGALAPLLTSIELQVEHYRYTHRLARSSTLEAVFPFWVHGAVRTDLSRQGGVDVQAITDAQINAWFSSRGIAPQFVYNWQPITGPAGSFTQWPTSVDFLLYSAGTWIRGASDIITLDTVYDSTLLAKNDFLALFTEEGWFVAKRGFDSRKVTVPLDPTGTTAGSVLLAASGAKAA